uniref:G_PROTEIN_RECEP_F1_2 domain-containing protein n=1 Tax=Macrostomum lignano TaxID=282301 RepID=A0A1I8GY21_9PLAT
MQACYALCMISGPLDLLEPLMAVFLSLFGAKDTRSVTPRERFLKSPTLFPIERGASPRASARLRCPKFILNLLRFNDNSKNIYADDYYRAALIESLFRTPLLLREFPGQAAEAYCCAAEEVTRHMNLEKLMPSYRMVVTVKCLRVFRKLQRTGYIPADIGIFKSYAAPGNYIDVRLAAMEAVVNHIKCAKDAAALAWLLDSTVCNPAEEASVRHQAVAMLTIQPPFLRRKRGQLDTPELVERLWRLLNTELSADCRLRCSVASLYHLLYGRHRPKPHKIAQRAPTPTPAPADTDDDNANFGLTGAGVGLGSSGDEADVDDDLDIGLEDDYEFAPDEPPIDEADFVWHPTPASRLPMPLHRRSRRPTMSSELQSSHWYQFWHSIDCNSTARWEPLREPSFLAFLCAADAAQCLLCLLSLLLNSLSYLALGRDGSDSTLAMQLRSLAVTDVIYVLANTIDNFCHTLETLPAPAGTPACSCCRFSATPLSGASGWPFITLHNWLMLFMAAVRFAKIRWPLRANLWFSRRRTRNWMGAIWIVAMATSLVRGLEVTSVLADCPDGFNRMAVVASRIFPAYTMAVNFGLQTVTPVVAVMVVNVLLLRTVRRSNNFQRDAAGGGSSPNSTIAVSTVSMASQRWSRPAGCQQQRREREEAGGAEAGEAVPPADPDGHPADVYMYLICQTPMVLYGFVVSFKIPTNLYIIMTLVGNVISSMDGTCNFFIYVVTNPKFKREVRQILGLATMNATGKVGQSGISMEAVGVAKQQQQQNRL